MIRVIATVKKDFKLLLKARWWSLLIILGPLFIIFLTSIAFDNANEYRINIGVYSPTYNQLTNQFIAKLNTEQFRTVKSLSSEECVNKIKLGLAHTCVVFPNQLVLGGEEKEIDIFIDYSNLNLAWIVRDRLFSRVEQQSTEIAQELTQNILSSLLLTQAELRQNAPLIALLQNNEGVVATQAEDTLTAFQELSGVLDKNLPSTLGSKIWSLKVAHDSAVEEADQAIEIAKDIVKKSEFEDDEKRVFREELENKRFAIAKEDNYIDTLFSTTFEGSFNNTLEELQSKIVTLNAALNSSSAQVGLVDQLANDNLNLLRRITYSLDTVQGAVEGVDELSAEDIAAPVIADIQPLSAYNNFLNFIFPTIMAIAIMLAALLLSTIIMVMEINSPAHFRNAIAPIHHDFFFLTSFLTNLSVIGLQVVVMLIIALFYFFTQVKGALFTTLVVSLVSASFFIVLGMGIALLFKKEQLAVLASTFTATLFLFLSNVLVPIENLPPQFLALVQYNPFILTASLLRKSLLFNQPFGALWPELLPLMVFTIGLLLAYLFIDYVKKELKN